MEAVWHEQVSPKKLRISSKSPVFRMKEDRSSMIPCLDNRCFVTKFASKYWGGVPRRPPAGDVCFARSSLPTDWWVP
jgi:hypothetical protein